MSRGDCVLDQLKIGNLNPLYEDVFPNLVLFARRFLPEEEMHLAPDCVQDVIIKAWDTRNKIDSEIALKAFLYTTLKNQILSIHRKRKARHNYISFLNSSEKVEHTIIELESGSLIYSAINSLPENERFVLKATFFEEKKISEIAEVLGVSDRTVKTYKASALKLLRESLNPELFNIVLLIILKKNLF